MKLKVYLAGPINGCSDSECINWREDAKRVLSDKYDVIDPMRRDYRGSEKTNSEEIVEKDLDDIITCDIILANCSKPSSGTSCELVYAKMWGLSVLSVGSKSPWVWYHSNKVFDTMNDALEHLINKKRE
jgi:nucleoside 2-deoxyribosyltransferase